MEDLILLPVRPGDLDYRVFFLVWRIIGHVVFVVFVDPQKGPLGTGNICERLAGLAENGQGKNEARFEGAGRAVTPHQDEPRRWVPWNKQTTPTFHSS